MAHQCSFLIDSTALKQPDIQDLVKTIVRFWHSVQQFKRAL